ncbi:BON domain-containing protein [Salidesulfovibrio onnuriiensis]|uniref:BON domain-containing protein n=1 Tax=Salidesulfovibrio onnuriiensis TaxID=2583823 RepID=UPI0011C96BA9|nr:BON domain-containing protein [Salidesulfovibrio onnuriiensis]
MKQLFFAIFMLAILASGGCAIVPVALTGASFATPQAVSLALTGVKVAHKGVLIAADERDADDMINDQFLDLQASAVAATASGVDADVHAYNGQVYVVGEYENEAAREKFVASLRDINGVEDVKGVLKSAETAEDLPVKDGFAESTIAANLIAELGLKSANVDVEVVQNEAVLVGVVETHQEERELEAFVNSLKVRDDLKGITVVSLVAVQQDRDAGINTADLEYRLQRIPGNSAFASAQQTAHTVAMSAPEVATDVTRARAWDPQTLADLSRKYKGYFSQWTRERVRLKQTLLTMAERETDADASRELQTLAHKIRTDKNTSIAARLENAMLHSGNLHTKIQVNALLRQYAPARSVNMSSLAMN